MATFVLVHGAWHGSWCWKRVRCELQARGHQVFTPTLTGVADRSHLLSPKVNLETHIRDVTGLLQWEELSNVILCGHSYGGCVVTGVADRLPQRIASLVYLDAFIAEHGKSLHDIVPPALREQQVAAAGRSGEGWKVPPIPAEVFNLNAADRDWVDRQCTMHPLAALQQPIELRHGGQAVANVSYVFATGYERSPFAPFFERAKANGWRTASIDAGHDVMLDRPEAVTDLLLESVP